MPNNDLKKKLDAANKSKVEANKAYVTKYK